MRAGPPPCGAARRARVCVRRPESAVDRRFEGLELRPQRVGRDPGRRRATTPKSRSPLDSSSSRRERRRPEHVNRGREPHEITELIRRVAARRPLGQDADHGDLLSVEWNRATDHLRITAELPSPERVADHGDGVRSGSIFPGQESAAERGRDAEEAEEVRRHPCRVELFGAAFPRRVVVVAPIAASPRTSGSSLSRPRYARRSPGPTDIGPRNPG